jgi:ribonucleoside-diphosphate reductase alpha chain
MKSSCRHQKNKSQTLEIPCPCDRVYVTVLFDDENKPIKVFSRLGKSGGCGAAVAGALTDTLSIALKSGISIDSLAKGLIGISCHRPPAKDGERKITSCADAIGHALYELASYL